VCKGLGRRARDDKSVWGVYEGVQGAARAYEDGDDIQGVVTSERAQGAGTACEGLWQPVPYAGTERARRGADVQRGCECAHYPALAPRLNRRGLHANRQKRVTFTREESHFVQ
jgi:hypothetical protein